MKKLSLLITTLLVFIISCNKIDTSTDIFSILLPVEVTSWDPEYAATVSRNIYVEEFTGHFCNNCPSGAREIKAIMEDHPAIILTAIHSTELADPKPGNPPIYTNNYKTPMGDKISGDLGIKAIPKATINRMPVNATEWGFDRSQWRSVIASINITDVSAGIELQCTVNEIKKEIEAQVAVTIIKAIPNPVQICLVLQQDSIISGQYDVSMPSGQQHIPDYVHEHMLRAGFNGNYGTKLTPNGRVEEQLKYTTTFKLNYEKYIPNANIPIVLSHCSVTAYLIDMETKEVLQVACMHLH